MNPGTAEVCDGKDNDCNGLVDDGISVVDAFPDLDGDGFGDDAGKVTSCSPPPDFVGVGGDCDDTDPEVNPGAEEVCNGKDDNCNSLIDEEIQEVIFFLDQDGDGFGDDGSSVSDCEQPPGFSPLGGDCDDLNQNVNPGAPEGLDGLDNDCDGLVDEGFPAELCQDARPLEPGLFPGDNALADDEPGLPPLCQVLTKDLWYSFSNDSTCEQSVVLSLCAQDGGAASFDGVIAVFEGDCGALVPVACDDDTCGQDPRVEFAAQPGTDYLIAVGTANGAPGGPFTLSVAATAAAVEVVGVSCPDPGLALSATAPFLGGTSTFDLTGAEPSSAGLLLFGVAADPPFLALPPSGCEVFLLPAPLDVLAVLFTDAAGDAAAQVALPDDPSLDCAAIGLQAFVAAPVLGGLQHSNGLKLVLGV